MKLIILVLKNIKNLLPYFIPIAIYFFFISIEASKENKLNNIIEKENVLYKNKNKNKNIVNDKGLRIIIPVVPYKEKIAN